MSFFGALFVALTMRWQWHMAGALLAAPFAVFAIIAAVAGHVLRLPGRGITPPPAVERAIQWSSAAEGIGLFVVAQILVGLHRAELLLPAMAMIVGLHFLPIALVARSAVYLALGTALILSAAAGFAIAAPANGIVAGLAAGLCLWTAAVLAVRRDRRAKASGFS